MSIVSVIRATAAVLALAGTSQVHAEGHHWSYGKHGGPGEWGELDKAFASCQLGKVQSPIDIRGAKAADLPAIKFDYKPVPLKLIDNGHTIQVNYPPGSSIDVGGTRYELVQFHFHKPSEEKIDGKAHAMVAHLVHKGADGTLAVVAVLLDKGEDNPVLRAIWSNLPKQKEKEVAAAATDRRGGAAAGRQGLLHVPGLAHDAAVQRGRSLVRPEDADDACRERARPRSPGSIR